MSTSLTPKIPLAPQPEKPMPHKAKAKRAIAVLKLETELAPYTTAIAQKHKFSVFYVEKAAKIQAKLDRLLQE